MKSLLLTLALSTLSAAPLHAAPFQELQESQAPTVRYYDCKAKNALSLVKVASPIFGRSVPAASGEGTTPNLLVLDPNRLLIFDTPEAAERILSFLEGLDVRQPVAEGDDTLELESVPYQPRYLTIDNVYTVLSRFETAFDDGTESITVLDDSQGVILRGDRLLLAQMQEELGRFDVAPPQIQITCMILQPSPEEAEVPVPAELAENLARLVPFPHFELVALGSVRASASQATHVGLDVGGQSDRFSLEMQIGGFHPEDSTLLLRQCSALRATAGGTNADGSPRVDRTVLFQTSTTVRLGEYCVLGAAGADPVFVALRVKSIEG